MELPGSGTADSYSSAADAAERIAAILKVIGEGERFLVCSHAGPDGDAVGSMIAMGMLLEKLGKRADLVSADRVPVVHRWLPGADRIEKALRVHGPYDAVILLECDGLERTRLQGLEKFFQVNIDHHASGVEFADVNWIDHEAACVGEMVYRLYKAAGVALTPEAANCIYTTVLTDTGGFLYGGTRASTFELARELTLAGADPIRVARQVYFSTPMSKLLLLGAALRNLHREGRVAWLWITHEDMMRSCAAEEDCEGIVNYALSISEVEVACFLRELEEPRVRVSLRSKGRVNVAAIAERLGGGGHENAAGCTLDGPLARAKEQIVAELKAAVGRGQERRSGVNLIA
jgi:bifunctional oligoribonuclease and PAP phosphatase NrnA